MTSGKQLKSAIVGAGFISKYHANAIAKINNAKLVAVCDLQRKSAESLAYNYSVTAYTDIQEMIDKENLDVIHILTQPDSHYFLASVALKAGINVVLEKPATISSSESKALEQMAQENGVKVTVNHNFIFSRPFAKLKEAMHKGKIGPVKSIRVVWKKRLPQASYGPWNLWMLRSPGNILFETGAHSLSELVSITGEIPKICSVTPLHEIKLPNGATFYRRWNISARSRETSATIDTSFDIGYDQHFVEVEGLFGVARADIENDYFSIDESTGRNYDIERLAINAREGKNRIASAFKTYCNYAGSKVSSSLLGGPYDYSMHKSIQSCYKHILGEHSDTETSLSFATTVEESAEAILEHLPPIEESPTSHPAVQSEPTLQTDALIVGASGFIGKTLLKTLLAQGKKVRAIVRNPWTLVDIPPHENLEIMVGDYRNEEFANKILKNNKVVFHLAVSHASSLPDYIKQNTTPTVSFAKLCMQHGIEKFIYTGTIDSLNLASAQPIREADGVDPQIRRRNNYAHSKAIAEQELLNLHKNNGLPLVIARPAIVLGNGGPIDHLGIANWSGVGRCKYWGDGSNPLPLVLVEDIVSGLIKIMETSEIEGKIYNLSSKPMLSAQEYVEIISNTLGAKIQTETGPAWKSFIGDAFKWTIKVLVGHPDKVRKPSIHDWKCREQHAWFDTTQAENDLAWKPCTDKATIIEKGVRQPTRFAMDN